MKRCSLLLCLLLVTLLYSVQAAERSAPVATGSSPAATVQSRASAASAAPAIKAWASLLQVMDGLEEYVATKELGAIHNEDMQLNSAVSLLLNQVKSAEKAEQSEQRSLALIAFSRAVADLHAAADNSDQAKSEIELKVVRNEFSQLKTLFDPNTFTAARTLADQRMCHMHPEIRGRKTDECSKCGMLLDQPVRQSLVISGGYPSQHTIRASIRTAEPLEVEKQTSATLRLTDFTGQPVPLKNLREVHTQKIHLLIIDSSLSDYHHEHPRATNTPGVYAFDFTPRKRGGYRAWADVRTTLTGLQEFAMTDITAPISGDPLVDRGEKLSSEVDGLRYELTLAEKEIKPEQPVAAKLRVATLDGKPFTELEPVMETFAHLVGFHEDQKTVMHMHPRGAAIRSADVRGGPELEFQFYATKPGFYRLFAQLQIGGQQKFAPFGIFVIAGRERQETENRLREKR